MYKNRQDRFVRKCLSQNPILLHLLVHIENLAGILGLHTALDISLKLNTCTPITIITLIITLCCPGKHEAQNDIIWDIYQTNITTKLDRKC